MTSVKVAVRVRPFNGREKASNSTAIIRMEGQDTYITNPETGKEQKFGFDQSYWSHDGFKEPEFANQYLVKDTPDSKYDDQDKVFNDLGHEVLDNAFAGYNACLFAYGQTGSGKSYSVVGYGENKGIVPRACEEIFKRITKLKSDTSKIIECQVTVSMIEIYNEKVQDLFMKPAQRPKEGLNVREHPKLGVYVENASDVPVDSYEAIERQLSVGNENRTIGQTAMNATSSRAHTVNRIIFKQIQKNKETGKPERELVSNINFIDLAGSERAESTGATGDRLKEGANINKSLSILGRVIGVLAKKANGQAKKEQVPYRESKLTMILKPFLGGNAKTSMVAALSPASINFDETLGTLRYAWQVKAIKNQAVVNESAQDKLIRELREEIERLRVSGGGGVASPREGGGGGAGEEALLQLQREQEEKFAQEKAEFERKLNEQNRDQQLRQAKEARLKTTPQLRNINQDPSMSGMIKFAFNEGDNFVGKTSAQFAPSIDIKGVGIANKQCCLNFNGDERKSTLIPNEEDPGKYPVKVNGELVNENLSLQHGDRILIGTHQYYLYVDPMIDQDAQYDWNVANKEANRDQLAQFQVNDEDFSAQLKAQEEKIKAEQEVREKELEEAKQRLEDEKKANMEELEKQKRELLSAGTDGEEAMKRMEEEREKFNQQMKEKEQQLEEERKAAQEELEKQMRNQLSEQQRQQQLREIDVKLQEIVPSIAEINTICRELGKEQVYYEPDIQTEVKSDGSKVSKVIVKVYPDRTNKEECGIIPCDQFTDVIYFNVKELYEDFEEKGFVSSDDPDGDGETYGWSLSDSWHEIGSVFLFLLSMYNLIDTHKDESPIIDTKGIKNGMQEYSVHLSVLDLDRQTPLNILEYETVRDLIGKHLKVKLTLKRAKDIPEKYSFKTMAKYEWIDNDRTGFETQVKERQPNPDFGYSAEHIELITEEFVEHLMYNTLTIKVMGMIESKRKNKNKGGSTTRDAYASDYQSEAPGDEDDADKSAKDGGKSGHAARQGTIKVKGGDNDRLSLLESQNAELKAQLEAAQRAGGKQAACCTIF